MDSPTPPKRPDTPPDRHAVFARSLMNVGGRYWIGADMHITQARVFFKVRSKQIDGYVIVGTRKASSRELHDYLESRGVVGLVQDQPTYMRPARRAVSFLERSAQE